MGYARIIQELYQNNDTKGLILTGDGDKAFVAGADIKEIASLTADPGPRTFETGTGAF
jgi:enoyl-CoA hydratase